MTEPNPTDPPNPPTPPPAPTPPGPGVPQEQVNDLVGRARNEGRGTAQREMLDKLGFKSLEEAEEAARRLKTIEDANKDELTKAAERATRAEAELETLKGGHTTATLSVRVETAVLRKLLGEDGGKVLTQASIIRKLIDVDSKAEDKDIEAAVVQLEKDMPQLFASSEGTGSGNPPGGGGRPPTPPAGRPPTGGPPRGDGGDAKSRALTRLHERNPHVKPRN